jgi:hypothetical protein
MDDKRFETTLTDYREIAVPVPLTQNDLDALKRKYCAGHSVIMVEGVLVEHRFILAILEAAMEFFSK